MHNFQFPFTFRMTYTALKGLLAHEFQISMDPCHKVFYLIKYFNGDPFLQCWYE